MLEKMMSWSYIKTINLKNFRKKMLKRKLEYKKPMQQLIDKFKGEVNSIRANHFVDMVEILEISHRSHVIEEDRLLMLIASLHEGLLRNEAELIRLSDLHHRLESKLEPDLT
jgi:hypothetical protein